MHVLKKKSLNTAKGCDLFWWKSKHKKWQRPFPTTHSCNAAVRRGSSYQYLQCYSLLVDSFHPLYFLFRQGNYLLMVMDNNNLHGCHSQ